ncbi:MAG: DUF3892 domain-containing protein [Oscillospiraceae bacterium]|nr:DUF3892 domain-containing protein [Oscillospiraceae bacterium]
MNEQNNQTMMPPSGINQHQSTAGEDGLSIIGLVKKSGKISGYQLSDGNTVTKEQGVELARQNKIRGVAVATNQGTEYLRALPDGAENNNLSNLPSSAQQ